MFASLAVLIVISILGCSSSDGKSGGKRPPLKFPVQVERVSVRNSDLVVRAVGSVEAFEIVPVTARVSGTVEKVGFTEGENVKAGKGLIEIDPERYLLALRSAEAAYEKSKANLAEVEAGLARRIDIQGKNPGFVSAEDLDNWQTRAQSARADSAQAAVNLEIAKLNYRDARVPAPVSGVIQSRVARTGQYLQVGSVVATMVRRDPLLLKFAVPVQDAQSLRTGQEAVFFVGSNKDTLRATTTAVSESADPDTRMVQVTAQVAKESAVGLQPGNFAEVAVMLGESKNLPIIPQVSIRPSERGFLAFVVEDTVAKERVLKLGLQTHDGMVEVIDGLVEGETLVVRGAEALSDGAAVRVVTEVAKSDTGAGS
ncbi:MAG: efflux RND transporter periplasmic adaptor subunit [Calditrichaeota bacterium]|nr:efflux RND transporter periplasmic adaptor subunit [Calditrichota bacterium]